MPSLVTLDEIKYLGCIPVRLNVHPFLTARRKTLLTIQPFHRTIMC